MHFGCIHFHICCVASVQMLVNDKTFGTIFIKRMGWQCFKMGATNGLQATCYPMHHGRIFNKDDSLEECMSKQLWTIAMKDPLTFMCLMHPSCLVSNIIQLKTRHVSVCVSSGRRGWHQNSSYWRLKGMQV